ncbi:unnamed protein product [Leptidea sinapis]|uniref:Uncharacterized protein n=1 Tax=Leptidea sinapis TaxID=189913 RepID=A0A5E4QE35_9NEOP|nr:unnamed protein product [Leptidea sinapis]
MLYKVVLELPLRNNDSLWNEQFVIISECEPRTSVYLISRSVGPRAPSANVRSCSQVEIGEKTKCPQMEVNHKNFVVQFLEKPFCTIDSEIINRLPIEIHVVQIKVHHSSINFKSSLIVSVHYNRASELVINPATGRLNFEQFHQNIYMKIHIHKDYPLPVGFSERIHFHEIDS